MESERLSTLKSLFERMRVRPNRGLGQNFCIDPNLLESIPRRAGIGREDFVLEIGSGSGFLTKSLCESAGFVLGVEIDGKLLSVARETVDGLENVSFFEGDILKKKSEIEPRVLEEVCSLMQERGLSRFKMVSNLPYSVATPVIMNMLNAEPRAESMTFLIQRELAEKITAKVGSKKYGPLSVLVGVRYGAYIVKLFGKAIFWPKPKVESALVRMDLRETPEISDFGEVGWVGFSWFVRQLFGSRRKMIKNILGGIFKNDDTVGLSDLDAPGLLRGLGINPDARAEDISFKKIVNLGEYYCKSIKK